MKIERKKLINQREKQKQLNWVIQSKIAHVIDNRIWIASIWFREKPQGSIVLVSRYSFETKREKKLYLTEIAIQKDTFFFNIIDKFILTIFLLILFPIDWYHSKEVLDTHVNKLALPFVRCTTAVVSQLYIKLCEKKRVTTWHAYSTLLHIAHE